MPETPAELLAAAEVRYLEVRDAHDRLEVARARGLATERRAGTLERALGSCRDALAAVDAATEARLGPDDRRAIAAMRRWLLETLPAGGGDLPIAESTDCTDEGALADAAEAGFAALSARIAACYSAAQSTVRVGNETITRLAVLGRLAEEPDATARRRLFLALEPVWRSIDGDGGPRSPYRRLLTLGAARAGAGPTSAGEAARAVGLDPDSIEPLLLAILEAWREAIAGEDPIEPWDWWYRAGDADRALSAALPVGRLRAVSDGYHAALGADPAALRVGFDIRPRRGRPGIPVAFTTFGRRRDPIEPWVLATYTRGGLGELTELVHETGHAIHLAAIRTRPAFRDWPDGDAFTEALAELTALDTAEPAWQERWLGRAAPAAASLRGRMADVVLDVAWALLEVRVRADPDRRPSDAWAEITSRHLGIVPHPEWSWWAMRGQLVQAPGYMANYAVGAILAADMRAAIRAARGDWTAGDPGWYGWVAERLYRWGLERSPGEVLAGLLGRKPTVDALVAQVRRAG